MEATAFKLGAQYSVVELHSSQKTDETKKDARIAFHFALDNSASMGGNTNLAQRSFAPLVDMASDSCSLTIFDSSAKTLSTSLKTAKQMCAIRLPRQGQTNISEGRRRQRDVRTRRRAQQRQIRPLYRLARARLLAGGVLGSRARDAGRRRQGGSIPCEGQQRVCGMVDSEQGCKLVQGASVQIVRSGVGEMPSRPVGFPGRSARCR